MVLAASCAPAGGPVTAPATPTARPHAGESTDGQTAQPDAGASTDGQPSPTPTATEPPGVKPRAGEVRTISGAGGLPAVVSMMPTKRKVVFLTIDDGWEQDPGFVQQVRDERVPITVFAMRDAVEAKGVPDQAGGTARYVGAGKWDYFRQLRDAGAPVESHTLTHPDLRTLGYAAQRREICGSARLIGEELGRRPELFRPPYGSYNTDTLRAAKSCGMDTVLLWSATVQPGGKIAYQVPDKKLRPGDILLMHFRPGLAHDFRVLVNKIKRRGFALGDLRAYLDAARPR